jgi:PhnB protein
MKTVNVYLNFNGDCQEAFNFYKSVLSGEFTYVGKYSEMPPQKGMPPIPDNEKNKIMHISLPISKETALMGSDSLKSFGPAVIAGNNFSISINTDTKDEAKRIFKGLSDGGKITMPLEKTFWADYFGMLTDKFGINWMVNVDSNEKK